MRCADFRKADLQKTYVEWYTHQVEVTNLFLWNVYGEIIHAAINFPGGWRDSKWATVSILYQDLL